jgi:hypothetical protein
MRFSTPKDLILITQLFILCCTYNFAFGASMEGLGVMKIEKLKHLVITVKNVNATINFYTKILNMEVLTLYRAGIEIKALKFGQQSINIHEAVKEIEPNALNATKI